MSIIYFIDVCVLAHAPHKADPTVICQCGAIISKYYMEKYIRTAKHARDMLRMCVCMYLCIYVYKP
jgi:hypothetical protein